MNETIESISEELWEQIKELLEEKMLELGVDEGRENWTRSEVSNKLITKLENNLLIDN